MKVAANHTTKQVEKDALKDLNIVDITFHFSPYLTCGTYEQLNYYANNFDDFAVSVLKLKFTIFFIVYYNCTYVCLVRDGWW